MVDQPRYQSLRDYLTVVRRRRRLILALTFVSVAITLGSAIRADPVYLSEAALSFREPSSDLSPIGVPEFSRQLPAERATDSAERALRPEVLRRAERRLGGLRIRNQLSARAETRTNFVIIGARDGDAKRAQQIAEAVAQSLERQTTIDTRKRFDEIIAGFRKRADDAFKLSTRQPAPGTRSKTRDDIAQARRAEIEAQLARLETAREVTSPASVVRHAQVSTVPVEPRPVRSGLLGLLIGLTVGLLAAFLRETLDQRLRGARPIVEHASLPLLGVISDEVLGKAIPQTEGGSDRELTEADLEPFRILRTNLEFLDIDKKITSVVVTSALPSEGKSTVAAALAVVAVLAGKRVLLIEGDMRRPVLAQRFGVEPTPGLTDFLAGRVSPREVMRMVPLAGDVVSSAGPVVGNSPTLVIIPAGTPAPRPAEMIGSERFAEFAHDVSSVYDLVIFDSCPLLPVVDTLEIIRHADAVVLAVRSDQTTRDQLRGAKLALERLPERPTGLVVTGLKPTSDDGAYSYAYTYAYDPA